MSTCRAEQRRQADRLGDTLALHATVVGVDILSPDAGPRAGWTVEATISRGSIPVGVLRTLAFAGANVVDATTQGPTHMIVTATV